jgi:hypothetical protein
LGLWIARITAPAFLSRDVFTLVSRRVLVVGRRGEDAPKKALRLPGQPNANYGENGYSARYSIAPTGFTHLEDRQRDVRNTTDNFDWSVRGLKAVRG